MSTQILQKKINELLPHLDERSRRLYLASEARALGHGGIACIATVSGYAECGYNFPTTGPAPRHD